jgi:hypothetical protein
MAGLQVTGNHADRLGALAVAAAELEVNSDDSAEVTAGDPHYACPLSFRITG